MVVVEISGGVPVLLDTVEIDFDLISSDFGEGMSLVVDELLSDDVTSTASPCLGSTDSVSS